MLGWEHLTVNSLGHLAIGGRDTLALAEEYGTPLFVMSEEAIRENCRLYRRSIERFYGGNGLAAYASKAFCCKAICRMVQEEGLGLDVVSAGELYTAKAADFPMDKVIFHGSNKTAEELTMALEYGVGRIVADNLTELRTLDALAAAKGTTAPVMLRVKPGIDAHTHEFIRTGQIDSKFGFALETGEAMAAVKEALAAKELELLGLHCHIGSQIFDIEPFCHAARVMLSLMAEIRQRTGLTLRELNLGGGFGVRYQEQDPQVDIPGNIRALAEHLEAGCKEKGYPLPRILLEPGRSIVADAGVTLYRVGGVKTIEGYRSYVTVNGGMTDNPRYALYQAPYTVLPADRMNDPADFLCSVAGRCCESGDLIQENIHLPQMQRGDLLAVLTTGAYNFTMASNYNRLCRPALVMLRDGKAHLAVRRQTFEDLTACEL